MCKYGRNGAWESRQENHSNEEDDYGESDDEDCDAELIAADQMIRNLHTIPLATTGNSNHFQFEKSDRAEGVFNEFHELPFQIRPTICTEIVVDGRPDAALLVNFSGILWFSFVSELSRFLPWWTILPLFIGTSLQTAALTSRMCIASTIIQVYRH